MTSRARTGRPERRDSRRTANPAQRRFEALADRSGGRLVLNLGAGATGQHDDVRTTVDVDVRRPQQTSLNAFVLADAAALPFASATFDGVVAKDVLEHVADVERCLREIARVTRPTSRIVVVTPRAVPRAVWADPTHLRGFTEQALLKALRGGGWEPVGRPRRLGPLPGADRLRLNLDAIEMVMRIPGLGHRFGTNWVLVATRSTAPTTTTTRTIS
jgi:SAM-dependent methyltransferase